MSKRVRLKSTDSLEVLGLSKRVFNALTRAPVRTIGELIQLIEAGNLLKVRNIGVKSAVEIEQALAQVEIICDNVSKRDSVSRSERTRGEKAEISSDVINWQLTTISKQLEIGLLHEEARISDKPLSELLSIVKEVDRRRAFEMMANAISGSLNICEELEFLLDRISRDDYVYVLLHRYGYEPETLQEIGSEVGVSRERIRQIGEKLENKLGRNVMLLMNIKPHRAWDRPTLLRIQTALRLARDMGMEITFQNWREFILSSGLMGSWSSDRYSNLEPFETMVAVCKSLVEHEIEELQIPINLEYAIELAVSGSPDMPADILRIRRTIPKSVKKLINRHYRFSGGVNAKWLSLETKKDQERVEDILCALGYRPFSHNWFVPQGYRRRPITNHDAFDHAVRKMFQYCGQLPAKDICAGLRLAASRTRFPIPPPQVLEEIMTIHGYEVEDEYWYWNGEMDENLCRGESIIMSCFDQYGPVVHHSELAEAFVDSELSFASLHATLRRSPLFDRIDTGLYKIRGVSVSHQDLERAVSAAERVPVEVDVQYDKCGNILVSTNLSVIAIGVGTILSEQLPNLTGCWDCYVGDRQFGKLQATENEFRHLSEPLEFLDCEAEDRVRFIFNAWERTVSIEKVEDSNTHG
jgi:hypothetical protein